MSPPNKNMRSVLFVQHTVAGLDPDVERLHGSVAISSEVVGWKSLHIAFPSALEGAAVGDVQTDQYGRWSR
jgi:hypothetical protein